MCLKITFWRNKYYYVYRRDHKKIALLVDVDKNYDHMVSVDKNNGNMIITRKGISLSPTGKGLIESLWRLHHNVKNNECYIYNEQYHKMKRDGLDTSINIYHV